MIYPREEQETTLIFETSTGQATNSGKSVLDEK